MAKQELLGAPCSMPGLWWQAKQRNPTLAGRARLIVRLCEFTNLLAIFHSPCVGNHWAK